MFIYIYIYIYTYAYAYAWKHGLGFRLHRDIRGRQRQHPDIHYLHYNRIGLRRRYGGSGGNQGLARKTEVRVEIKGGAYNLEFRVKEMLFCAPGYTPTPAASPRHSLPFLHAPRTTSAVRGFERKPGSSVQGEKLGGELISGAVRMV